jgi:hypothetical protein
MKSNKDPGLDGLTIEFYREFLGKVKFVNAVLEHKKEVLNQHLKEKLVYYYLELRDPPF